MPEDFTATISSTSQRAETWRQILGTRTINLKSFLPTYANLPEKPNAKIYELDLILLTTEQRQRLIIYLSKKFNFTKAYVERNLDALGCPILAEDVVMTVRNPQKWFG